MPSIYDSDRHHCYCGQASAFAPHGKCHVFCDIHTDYFFRPGQVCEKCQREARATAKKEKEAKKQDSKRKAKADSISWFKDNSKERKKPRTKDDDKKERKMSRLWIEN
ncbi:hypothetical protein HII31_06253 [Pseudocercospora fuligena]|uniref:Uncharacterized protein n=1 Tax=Pseudocercospora fuligena TaxID=685502 RepID=A0A8H6RJK1_9PEZI|nr:hypothetical protein HII31_06253 [Pseudocercospora fuligena]